MSHENRLPFSENEIIPRLRAVQEVFMKNDDPIKQTENTKVALAALDLDQLLGETLLIDSSLAFARRPDESLDTRMMYPSGFMFLGRLIGYAQLVDEDVPVNAVTVNFSNPDIITLPSEEAIGMRRLQLEIPVLAINTVVNTWAA
ncbi:MAG: hypothetical protein QFB86_03070 [Patescibacteria group bacterium]|nr:hypothetical protein [Patescibacteria group bacterium]